MAGVVGPIAPNAEADLEELVVVGMVAVWVRLGIAKDESGEEGSVETREEGAKRRMRLRPDFPSPCSCSNRGDLMTSQ